MQTIELSAGVLAYVAEHSGEGADFTKVFMFLQECAKSSDEEVQTGVVYGLQRLYDNTGSKFNCLQIYQLIKDIRWDSSHDSVRNLAGKLYDMLGS